jgi:hypothetical protein
MVAALLFFVSPVSTHCQAQSGINPQDILARLAPDDAPPPSLRVKSADRAGVIRELLAAKRNETGWHRELAEYLLATLGQDYDLNRDALLRVWRRDGDDGTMGLLIQLYEQGHKEVLQPLLARYDGWNAATTEGLGTFYSDELEKEPEAFLAVLSTFPQKRQLALCTAAGGTDGGGMGPGVERKVLNNLKRIGGEAAALCARGVRAGNREAEAANRDLQPDQPKK